MRDTNRVPYSPGALYPQSASQEREPPLGARRVRRAPTKLDSAHNSTVLRSARRKTPCFWAVCSDTMEPMSSEPDLLRRLPVANPWWKGPGWEVRDPDLVAAAAAPFSLRRSILADVAPDGMYLLLGPRRVGKSVEIKRTISDLLTGGMVRPRQVIHFACDGLTSADLHHLVRLARDVMTAEETGPRYWFLDEITAITKGWPGAIKYLRDNHAGFAQDCVVLTGSSSRQLLEARKALAGRYGTAPTRRERYLFPLSFREFTATTRGPDLPDLSPVRAADWISRESREAVDALIPWLTDLGTSWDIYCRVGGYPRAIADFLTLGEHSDQFVQDLWSVIEGDALQQPGFVTTPTQTSLLIDGLTSRLAQPVSVRALTEQVGFESHHTLESRMSLLEQALLTWRCYPARRGRLYAAPKEQYKYYFVDPLLARLASIRNPGAFATDTAIVTEQQIGHLLLRRRETESEGAVVDFTHLLFLRTPNDREVDFLAAWSDGVAFESKYSEGRLGRDTLTSRAEIQAGAIRGVVFATRGELRLEGDVWMVPAGILGWLLVR